MFEKYDNYLKLDKPELLPLIHEAIIKKDDTLLYFLCANSNFEDSDLYSILKSPLGIKFSKLLNSDLGTIVIQNKNLSDKTIELLTTKKYIHLLNKAIQNSSLSADQLDSLYSTCIRLSYKEFLNLFLLNTNISFSLFNHIIQNKDIDIVTAQFNCKSKNVAKALQEKIDSL